MLLQFAFLLVIIGVFLGCPGFDVILYASAFFVGLPFLVFILILLVFAVMFFKMISHGNF